MSGNITPMSENEVIQEIKRLKIDIIPRLDGITNEAIKAAYTLLTPPLTYIFNRILETA